VIFDLEPTHRRLPVRFFAIWLGCLMSNSPAEPVAVSPLWQVNFTASNGVGVIKSIAVPLDNGSLLVSVVGPGADPATPKLLLGKRAMPFEVIGHDPVSRLGFIRAEGTVPGKVPEWRKDASGSASASLTAITPDGSVKCRSTGWVKQVGGKILPLALLRVTFADQVPPPGTPLMDESGRVAAVIFQDTGIGNTCYAIPAEAVRRVQRDISKSGRLIRGWLGLSLRAETQSPQVVRILPNSPASAAGIQPGDVLAAIGTRKISDYADAANAFFYLIPGQPVRVKLLRGVDEFEFTLTPTEPGPN